MSVTPDIFEPRDLVPKIFSNFEVLFETALPELPFAELPFVEEPEPSWFTHYQTIEWEEQAFQQLYSEFYGSHFIWHPFEETWWDSEWSQISGSDDIFGYRPEGWEF
jgi:hypothetical protein